MMMIKGQNKFQKSKLAMYPVDCRNSPRPAIMIIAPKTRAAIMPPLGKPKHSPSIRL
jgi:hypothetical protein